MRKCSKELSGKILISKDIVKKNKEMIILGICIFWHTIFLYLICDFGKTIETYSDELLYYNIARSIFNNQGIQLHGVPFFTQSLAYSYVLVPFFFITNSVLRMHVITFANAFLMSLCVIPVWFICKELDLSKKFRWFVIILIMVWPDMLTAGTFMSENLYWILTLTAMYFCLKSIYTQKKVHTVIAAVFCYLAYFCKAIAVCQFLTFIAFQILHPCVNWFFAKDDTKEKNPYKGFLKEEKGIHLAIFILTYGICYFLFKVILFGSMKYTYIGEMDYSIFNDWYSCLYFFYGLIYYVLAVVIAFMIYPAVYPLIHYKKISSKAQKMFLYAWIFLMGSIIVIVFMITVTEDLGAVVPRIHLRYLAPITGLLFPVFFKAVSDTHTDPEHILKSRKTQFIFLMIFWLICCFAFKGVPTGCANEHLGLFYGQFLADRISDLYKSASTKVVFYPDAIMINIIIGMMLIVWNMIQHSKKRSRYFSSVIFVSVCFVSLLNLNLGASNLRRTYGVDDSQIIEMSVINNYFKEHDLGEKNVMLVCQDWTTKNAKVYDTYFDGNNNLSISYEILLDKMYEMGGIDIQISDIDFHELVRGRPYHIGEIDYLILGDSVISLDPVIGGLEFIPEISGEIYKVYKNVDASNFILPIRSDVAEGEPLIELYFAKEAYNAELFIESGLSYCEKEHTWTDGDELQFRARVPNTVGTVKIQFDLAGTYNGNQEVLVYQGENRIYEDTVSGAGTFSFELKPVNGDCGFRMCFPDAVSPYDLGESIDPRKLAIGLQKITISKER